MVRRESYWDVNIMISCPQAAKEARVEAAAYRVVLGAWGRLPP